MKGEYSLTCSDPDANGLNRIEAPGLSKSCLVQLGVSHQPL